MSLREIRASTPTWQPITFGGERNQPGPPPPMLGQHTLQILGDFGHSPEEIAQFQIDKVVRIGG